MLERIEIKNRFDISELTRRLQEVRLRGFRDVKIYENANVSIEAFTPEKVRELFTPQPSVYRPALDRIGKMVEMFGKEGIDIFNLNGGVDYTAFDETGEATDWTLIPPVVEVVPINFLHKTGLDYSSMLSEELANSMKANNHFLNPHVGRLWFEEFDKYSGIQKVPIICDGSHRIHAAYERGLGQNLLVIDNPRANGYPYYAAPKPYSLVHVEAERDETKIDKTHILTEPGHKLLYRLFPSGGILSGDVRTGKIK